MGLLEIVLGLFDDTESVGHKKKDNVHLFGSLAGVFIFISGIVLYVIMNGSGVEWYIRDMGLLWVLFAVFDFFSLYVFEHEDRKTGARMLAYAGVAGFVLGVGFFIGAFIMLFSGLLAMKYSFKRIGEKVN